MVLLHIVSKNNQQLTEIVDYLLEEKLILNAIIQENVVIRKNIDGEFKSEKRVMMIGKTKALLFNTIDTMLRQKFSSNMPVLYAVPIVAMDWEQADELVRETTKV